MNFDNVLTGPPKQLNGYNDWSNIRLDQVGAGTDGYTQELANGTRFGDMAPGTWARVSRIRPTASRIRPMATKIRPTVLRGSGRWLRDLADGFEDQADGFEDSGGRPGRGYASPDQRSEHSLAQLA